MLRDYEVLIGANDEDRHGRTRDTEHVVVLRVARGIDAKTECSEAIADFGAHVCGVLTNRTGEDEKIDVSECGDEAADGLLNAVSEHVDR